MENAAGIGRVQVEVCLCLFFSLSLSLSPLLSYLAFIELSYTLGERTPTKTLSRRPLPLEHDATRGMHFGVLR